MCAASWNGFPRLQVACVSIAFVTGLSVVNTILVSKGNAQIGFTLDQLGPDIGEYSYPDDFDIAMGTRSIDLETAKLSLRDGKVVCIRAREPSDFTGHSLVPTGENLATLTNCTHMVDGRPTHAEWSLAPRFFDLFPAIGTSGFSADPEFVETGRQVRTLTIDTKTGRVIGRSPWTDELVPTGRFIAFAHKYAIMKPVLVSGDGRLFATATIERQVTIRQDGAFETTAHGSNVIVCDADFFWSYVSANITPGFDYTPYEQRLGYFVGDYLSYEVELHRIAVKLVLQTECSSIPLEQIRHELSEHGMSLDAAVASLLSRPSRNLHVTAQSRQVQMLAEIGGVAEIEALVSRMRGRRDGNWRELKPVVVLALQSIAERHQLAGIPDDHASVSEWRAWAREMTQMAR